ncbi:hypothetical protein [Arthrobacter sp. SPG23]|uniref:hypothetical protein n=1 Tax=Arthrobacter sp. SPG23 TaxID=1610703 RepID=UPI000AC0557D|nr:hypothetical protein [Arthrobacter sp. SPG23]
MDEALVEALEFVAPFVVDDVDDKGASGRRLTLCVLAFLGRSLGFPHSPTGG